MPAFLVPIDPGQCLIPLEKAIVLIGRQADCDVSLTLSRKISRKHCCIAQVNNSFVVRDLGSTNGVYLNGNRVQKEATIAMGDNLVIGDVRFRLQNEATAPPRKKAGEENGADKSVEKSVNAQRPGPPPAAGAARAVKRQMEPPPSMDIPIAIPEDGPDFQVEATSFRHQIISRKPRVDDVVPLSDEEIQESDDEDQDGVPPMKLA